MKRSSPETGNIGRNTVTVVGWIIRQESVDGLVRRMTREISRLPVSIIFTDDRNYHHRLSGQFLEAFQNPFFANGMMNNFF
ncbi:hypothetical protein ACKUB1_18380 [Methanospirillum stamsii]|uniref:Uncharacterized protein n=1 Tax=Methanospirillum stamsii TaxID=1277351 RepID=A0A2V2N7P0_9EURY|nr:hypothetical protein DLD82_02045 [Methanospirillum stamsii]